MGQDRDETAGEFTARLKNGLVKIVFVVVVVIELNKPMLYFGLDIWSYIWGLKTKVLISVQ